MSMTTSGPCTGGLAAAALAAAGLAMVLAASSAARGRRRRQPRAHAPCDEQSVDATIEDSFPASDPPAWSPVSSTSPRTGREG